MRHIDRYGKLAIVCLIADAAIGCSKPEQGATIRIGPGGTDCTVNEAKLDCAGVVSAIAGDLKLSHDAYIGVTTACAQQLRSESELVGELQRAGYRNAMGAFDDTVPAKNYDCGH
jgi:hypothetical protein